MQPIEQLVDSAQSGDRLAIEQLVHRYEHASIVAAWTIVGDFHLAQDVAQESLVDAFRQLHQLRQKSAFGSWLLTSVRRRARRARAKIPKEIQGLELSDLIPARDSWRVEFQETLPMLAQLPEQELDVVNLRYVNGLSVKSRGSFRISSRNLESEFITFPLRTRIQVAQISA